MQQAQNQDRTGDLILTKDVLYQLSYLGLKPTCRQSKPETNTQNGHTSPIGEPEEYPVGKNLSSHISGDFPQPVELPTPWQPSCSRLAHYTNKARPNRQRRVILGQSKELTYYLPFDCACDWRFFASMFFSSESSPGTSQAARSASLVVVSNGNM